MSFGNAVNKLRPRRYDVVVLGGGPAGLGVALALAGRQDLSLAVVERSSYEVFRVGETLSPAARKILEGLGVWQEFVDDAHLPSPGSCSAWGSPKLSFHDYMFHPWGSGWHLDRRQFDRTLARLAEERGVDLLTGVRYRRSRPSVGAGYDIDLRDEVGRDLTLGARFVVDATGRRAAFARSRGARREVVDRMVGIYGFFHLLPGQAFDSFTLVEARPEGWWYSALLPAGRVVVALMTDRHAVRRGAAKAATWNDLLDAAPRTRERLIACVAEARPLRILAASVCRTSIISGVDWLSVGDTASAFDPLSSQGILKALGAAGPAAAGVLAALAGNQQPTRLYDAAVSKELEDHLATRKTYYEMETRWADAPFWRNRSHTYCSKTGRTSP